LRVNASRISVAGYADSKQTHAGSGGQPDTRITPNYREAKSTLSAYVFTPIRTANWVSMRSPAASIVLVEKPIAAHIDEAQCMRYVGDTAPLLP